MGGPPRPSSPGVFAGAAHQPVSHHRPSPRRPRAESIDSEGDDIVTTAVDAARPELTAQALSQWKNGHSILLEGDPGMGKSTLLRAIAVAISRRPGLTLSASPAESDARMPFVTLIDLLSDMPAEHFEQLPAPTLRIVELALRRRDPARGGMDTLAVCLALLDLLRTVTDAAPTTLVIDDLQWVDPASAEVLTFAVRRLEAGRLSVVAAVRPGDSIRFNPPDTVTLKVGPLPADILVPAVMARARGLVGRPVADEICTLSGGNPLFALEIADAVQRKGVRPVPGQPLPVPVHLETLMRHRLAGLPAAVRDTVRLAATAHRPTLELLIRAGRTNAIADLTVASEAGICDLDSRGVVSFGHPMLRAAVHAEPPLIVRMALHARLVQVTTDPIERAWHLALATGLEDETVAVALSTAAELAGRRGATAAARELSGLAALRTPAADQAGWAERKLTEARYAHHAGLLSEAREAAEAVLATDVPARLRVNAWMVLFDTSGTAIGRMGEQVTAALADAEGDRHLEAWMRLYSALHEGTAGRVELALTEAERAVRAAVAVGDPHAEIRALHVLLTVKTRLGLPHEEEMTRISWLLAQGIDVGPATNLIYHGLGCSYLDTDRYDEAADVLHRAVRLAEESGMLGGLDWVLHLLAQVEWRRGRCAAAITIVNRFRQLVIDVEPANGYLRRWTSAEAEAITGSLTRAIEIAGQVITELEAAGEEAQLAQLRHALGTWCLILGDPARAVAVLRRAHASVARLPTTNQRRKLTADLIEALVGVGDQVAAADLLDELRRIGPEPASGTAAVAQQRAAAVVAFAEGRADTALALLAGAADTCRASGAPIELSRVLLLAAAMHRRRRRRAAARALLDEAAQICRTAGAKVWLHRVEEELARLTPVPRGGETTLTPMQDRIAALVVKGATNREIAAALSIGVTTVEASLTQIYRRFCIRSRVELVRVLDSTRRGAA